MRSTLLLMFLSIGSLSDTFEPPQMATLTSPERPSMRSKHWISVRSWKPTHLTGASMPVTEVWARWEAEKASLQKTSTLKPHV